MSPQQPHIILVASGRTLIHTADWHGLPSATIYHFGCFRDGIPTAEGFQLLPQQPSIILVASGRTPVRQLSSPESLSNHLSFWLLQGPWRKANIPDVLIGIFRAAPDGKRSGLDPNFSAEGAV
jgi:hypothetical protein